VSETPRTPPPDDAANRRQKARDAALILPVLGAAALMPPFATVFAVDGVAFGVPVVVLYVFGVWAGLILAAFLLARPLGREQPAPERPRHPRGR